MSLSFVALSCVRLCCAWCVAFADLPWRWPVRAPTKVGGLAFERVRSLFRRLKWGVLVLA